MNFEAESQRKWGPFHRTVDAMTSPENSAQIAFFHEAQQRGLRTYYERSDYGAVDVDGRSAHIVWRGRARAELFLIEKGHIVSCRMFVNPTPYESCRDATQVAMEWFDSAASTAPPF